MVSETKNLEGKVAIITGGGSGMGKATALTLARAGADIVVAARRVELIEQTAGEVRALGRRALGIPTDITVSQQVNSMVERTVAEMGRVDILVNNSGIVRVGPRTRPIWDTSDEEYHLHMDTNLTGCFYCCRAVSKYMADQQSGKIISISSEAGLRGAIDWYMYPVAKMGVIELTRSLALSLAQYNIQSNCIVPGMIDTHEFQPARPPGEPVMTGNTAMAEAIPVGRIGAPADIADLVLFLASDASAYINGGVFNPVGGRLAGGFAMTGYAPTIDMEEV